MGRIYSGILSGTAPLQLASNSLLDYIQIVNMLPSINELFDTVNNSWKGLNPGVCAMIQLLVTNSMRFTELKRVTAGDYLGNTMFIVHSAKGSASYKISIPLSEHNKTILMVMDVGQNLFPFSYQQVRRDMLKVGLGARVAGRANRAVTHIGRYMLADKLKKMDERDVCSDLLHHRSKRNKEFYLRENLD